MVNNEVEVLLCMKTVLHSKVFAKARKLAEEESNEPYNLPFTDVDWKLGEINCQKQPQGLHRIHPALFNQTIYLYPIYKKRGQSNHKMK